MEIKLKNTNIDIPDVPIGVTCSGGADSSLLLYILMKYSTQPIHIFSGAFGVKKRSVINHTPAIIDKCIELTGKNDVFQHIVFCQEENQDEIIKLAKKYLDIGQVQIVFTGVTSVPPDSVTSEFTDQAAMTFIYKERNPNIIKPIWQGAKKRFYTPFINFNKQDIADLYSQYGILDSLFPLTRSCENKTSFVGHCGNCWWCQERFWAFNRYQ